MTAVPCPRCEQVLFFENDTCLRCGTEVGFAPDLGTVAALDPERARCVHHPDRSCNWLVPVAGGDRACLACRLTRAHPEPGVDHPDDVEHWLEVETAKRHLVAELLTLGIAVHPLDEKPSGGLVFDLLSSRNVPVTTGHADGVVTIDLAEADDVHRERVRVRLDEPYRTVLGHLRHETGHWWWQVVVAPDPDRLASFRDVFGDEREDYAEALRRNYDDGPPPDWQQRHVSSYAAAHPWEDVAETFAHVLHLLDGLRTADAVGLRLEAPAANAYEVSSNDGRSFGPFEVEVRRWLATTMVLNAMNRSIGREDAYPFVLSDEVVGKLAWVRDVIATTGS